MLNAAGRLDLYGWFSNQRLITSLLDASRDYGEFLVKTIEDADSGSRFITLSGPADQRPARGDAHSGGPY